MGEGAGRPVDAGDAVVRALEAVAAELDATLGPALLDQPDGVHRHRKAVRRLRSTLSAYRPFFDDEAVRHLHRVYRDWGRELGEVRDAEVRIAVTRRFLDVDEGSSADHRALEDLQRDHRSAERWVARRGTSLVAVRRRSDLADFLAAPPRTEKARRPAARSLRRRLVKEGERVLRRAETAAAEPASLPALHELRKAARRLRYATEAVTRPPVGLFGAKAPALADSAERIHDLLGDHRDAIAFAESYASVDRPADSPAVRARAVAAARLSALPCAVEELRDALARFR